MTSAFNYEMALRGEAQRWPAYPSWRELDVSALAGIAQRYGLDFATAVLYERIQQSAENQQLTEMLSSACLPDDARALPLVVIVPGAGYREHPETGADGQRVRELASGKFPAFRGRVDLCPVASFGSLSANAQTIIDWLLDCPEHDVILVTLSKGSADLRRAFAHRDAARALARVRTWISLSGIPFGTALADWILQRPLRRWLVRLLCWYRERPFELLGELQRDATGTMAPPPHLQIYHVVGLPLQRSLSNSWARRTHRRLGAALGPNDGGGFLLGDVTRLPGTVIPLWGCDHYLQGADPVFAKYVDGWIARLLAHASRDMPANLVPGG